MLRCLNCGNEIGQDEVFCGQCGTPNTPPSQPPKMVNTPLLRSEHLSSYNGNMPSAPGASNSSPNIYNMPPSGSSLPPNQPRQPGWLSSSQQQPGFYQDPTEAMPSPPNSHSQGYPPSYQQPTQAPVPGSYPGTGQYSPQVQPFQTGNYSGPVYPQAPQFQTGQAYRAPTKVTPPPKQQTSAVLVIAIVCLIVAIITVSTFGVIYILRGHTPPQTTAIPTSVPTLAPSPVPTDTPTPIPSPTTAITPTPIPDAGFASCGQTCATNGFSVEYPQGWNSDSPGPSTIRFSNPSQPDEYAAFKTPGATTSTADELVASDLQTVTGASSDNTTPTPTASSTTTIGGETWTYTTAMYQSNGQTKRVQVYATVHQGKAYIIELQALHRQFEAAYARFFTPMLFNTNSANSFQFVQSTT